MGRIFSIDRKLDLVDRKLDWVGAMLTRSNTEHEHATLVPLRFLVHCDFVLIEGGCPHVSIGAKTVIFRSDCYYLAKRSSHDLINALTTIIH